MKKSLKKKPLNKSLKNKKIIKKKSIKKSIKKKMNHKFGSSSDTVGVISDIEGKWKALETYASRRNSVLDSEKLKEFSDEFDKLKNENNIIKNDINFEIEDVLKKNCKLVFVGDLIDNGPDNIKLLTFFNSLKKKYGEQIILIAGNRDINKLRLNFLIKENDEFEKDINRIDVWKKSWEELKIKNDSPSITDKLKFIFDNTMGAKGLFDRIKSELSFIKDKNTVQQNDDVVSKYILNNYLNLVKQYLKESQLIHVDTNTHSIFIHGGIHNDNYLTFIDKTKEKEKNFNNWITLLNKEFSEIIDHDNFKDLLPLFQYQESPLDPNDNSKWKGESNDLSVLHSRPWDPIKNNLRKIDIVKDNCYVTKLLENGINKEFVGHSPVGKLPVMIKKKIDKSLLKNLKHDFDYFYKVMCDTSAEVTATDAKYTPTISVTKDQIEIIDNFFCDKDTCKELVYGSFDDLVGKRFQINDIDYWIISKYLDIYLCATWRKEGYISPMYLLIFDGYLKNYLVD